MAVRATQTSGSISVQHRGAACEASIEAHRTRHNHLRFVSGTHSFIVVVWSRYFSEMLSSQFMGNEIDGALNSFRESHGGTLSGMTRCDAFGFLPTCCTVQNSITFKQTIQSAIS
eukprot:COSAG02_NODE_175_length_31226_cov_95.275934_11_plen_115_part_00